MAIDVLSFRERVVIALVTKIGLDQDLKDTIGDAQYLARECCSAWGHQYYAGPAAGCLASSTFCARCGEKFKQVATDDRVEWVPCK